MSRGGKRSDCEYRVNRKAHQCPVTRPNIKGRPDWSRFGVFGSNLPQKGAPSMDSVKYIGMDVHKEAISIAVLNSPGKLVMECTIETKASTILDFLKGLRGSLHVTLEEGT